MSSSQLTLFAEDSPVRTSRSPVKVPDSLAAAQACGQSSRGSFAWLDLATSSWRTYQGSLVEEWELYSATFPPSGTMRSGRAYQRPRLVPHISGRESSLLPTPQAHDTAPGDPSRVGRHGTKHGGRDLNDWTAFREAKGMWPTPNSGNFNDSEDPESFLERRERLKEKGINGNGAGIPLAVAAKMWPTPSKSDGEGSRTLPEGTTETGMTPEGKKRHVGLNNAARMWPTPTQSDGMGGPGASGRDGGQNLRTAANLFPTPTENDSRNGKNQNAKRKEGSKHHTGTTLCDYVETWPTPTSRDWRSGRGATEREGHALPLSSRVGGQLNPQFVEWLMGFPRDWTEV